MADQEPRFLNPNHFASDYKFNGSYEFVKEMRNGNIVTYFLEKELGNIDSANRERKGKVQVRITSIDDMKKDGSSYGKAIAEIRFPAIMKGNKASIKEVTFEYDRSDKGLVLKAIEKNESVRRTF